jgi:hypothetical protein
MEDQLAAHRRMRACLAGILDLDPPGVSARIAELDREISHLEQVLGAATPADRDAATAPVEVRAPVRAA